jgi:rhamnogalacturonyl hydrolase YesR
MRIAVVLFLFFTNLSFAQSVSKSDELALKNNIKRALSEASQHAINTALDKNGKARGDYEMVKGEWFEYEPAWHTGQLINGLLAAYEITKDKRNLQAAIRAGNWWVKLQFTKNQLLNGFLNAIHEAEVGNYINTTTITDGTPGLFRLSKITKNPQYATVATEAGEYILKNLYLEKEQLIYNIVDPVSGEIWKDKSPHKQHENKAITFEMVARPNAEGYLFKQMYDFTKNEKYKNAFLNLCNGLVNKQSENGFWMDFEPNDASNGKIHARFNTWNAEALLEAYEISEDKKYLEAATKTAQALAKIQQKNSIIYYTTYSSGAFEKESPCGSAVSFAGILWLKLKALGNNSFNQNIEKALAFTLQNQFPINHPDKNLAGSFFEIRQKTSKNGAIELQVRDLATAFGLRFLSDYYHISFKN